MEIYLFRGDIVALFCWRGVKLCYGRKERKGAIRMLDQ